MPTPQLAGGRRHSPAETLVAAAAAGDRVACDRLIEEILPLVVRYCRARMGRWEGAAGSADDVAQATCRAAVKALPTYVVSGLPFRAFVYGIAAHAVTDAFRAGGRNPSEPVAAEPDIAPHGDVPEGHMLAHEPTERLGGLLHRLTRLQREVLVLRIAAGLSAEETARAVGSTPGAVRAMQHRALTRLRTSIRPPHDRAAEAARSPRARPSPP